MKKIVSCLVSLILMFISTVSINANSECNAILKLSNDHVQKGEELVLSLHMDSLSNVNIATFRVKVWFDKTKLKFKGIEAKENIDTSKFKYYEENGTVTVIYLEPDGGIALKPNEDIGILDFKFKTLDTAAAGASELSAKIDGIGDSDVNEISCSGINPINFNILEPDYSSCRLSSLEVSEGTLVPEFDPYITEYSLSVPYEVSSIEVYATPQDSSDSVKVNRKTLGKGGSYTDINVTVTSKDKKTKLVYRINTYRGLKGTSVSSSSSKTKSSTSSSSGKSNSSGNASDKSSGSKSDTGSKKLYTNGNGEENSILVKNNTFSSFMFGLLISAVAGIIIYVIYKYSKGPKGKH